ncbi:MAG: YkgJ family cysteine cluster protein [Candidatus Heimdallarchaeaceae archaeon]
MLSSSEKKRICSQICGSKCCKSTPPVLTSEDLQKIGSVIKNNSWYLTIKKEGKKFFIVSKKDKKDACFFLSDEGLCEIYDNRPLDCKLFPILFKLNKKGDNKFLIKWLVWHCPLSEMSSIENLVEEAKKILISYLSNKPQYLFEYKKAMFASGGYKKKHFLNEELIIVNESDVAK